MPPRNLLPCKSDDREQRAVVPGPQGPLSSRPIKAKRPELLTPAAACTPGPPERDPRLASLLQVARLGSAPASCSGRAVVPYHPRHPPAQSRQAAASPSEGNWAAAASLPRHLSGPWPPPCPPRRQPHPRGSPTRQGIPASAPLVPETSGPQHKGPRLGPGWGWGEPQPRPQPRVQLCAPGPLVRSLTHLPGAAPCVGRAAPGGAGPRARGCGAPVLHDAGCRRPREDVTGPRVAHTLRRPGSLLRPPAPPASGSTRSAPRRRRQGAESRAQPVARPTAGGVCRSPAPHHALPPDH